MAERRLRPVVNAHQRADTSAIGKKIFWVGHNLFWGDFPGDRMTGRAIVLTFPATVR
jgi:hypothetical protein